MQTLETVLAATSFQPVIPAALQWGRAIILDMNAPIWQKLSFASVANLIQLTQALMQEVGAVVAIGRYAENRVYLYKQHALFSAQKNLRSIHLGIDLGVPVKTPVYTPLKGVLHSFADNNNAGDYGPTILLAHQLAGHIFYTLYGHLSRSSLINLTVGTEFAAGEQIGTVGDSHENGGWPSHLHFQIIKELENQQGDYPGVAAPEEAAKYLANCPDPNLILRLSI
ncbi:MAG: hypothetical protein A3E87_04520 [Gammaproteobacteria bacterium RIFCSPHIGHO2_12_FULL_35_23]|nr:MAG: hypothetical protein A3E87_04520 [Gammaproteobacteria bacterium RIFCSPHIGHO2_12_FULL_35_23]